MSSNYNNDTCGNVFIRNITSNTKGVNELALNFRAGREWE